MVGSLNPLEGPYVEVQGIKYVDTSQAPKSI